MMTYDAASPDMLGDESPTEISNEIGSLVHRIRALQQETDRVHSEIEETKQDLAALLKRYGNLWTDDHGYARLVKAYVLRSYEAEALDRLILSDPLRYGWLADYRRQRLFQDWVLVR